MEFDGVTVAETASMSNMSEDNISSLKRTGTAELLQFLEGGAILVRIRVRVQKRGYSEILQIMSRWSDTVDNLNSFDKQWDMNLLEQERLRLLETIGACRSLREVTIGVLNGKELETLLKPLQFSPVLESIEIESGLAERTCKILGIILRTSGTLKSLILDVPILTTGLSHMASGLRGNDHPTLERLYLRVVRGNDHSTLERLYLKGAQTEQTAVTHVAEIVQSAPRLLELTLAGGWVLDNDTLANALAQSTSLKSLTLKDDRSPIFFLADHSMGRLSAFLLKALAGEGSNSSITSLHLHGVPKIQDSFPRLLASNHSLKVLEWDREYSGHEYIEGANPKEWQRLGQSLASSSSLELIVVRSLGFSHTEAIDCVEALLTSADVKKAFVEVYLSQDVSRYDWELEELSQENRNPILKLHFGRVKPDSGEIMWKALLRSSSLRILRLKYFSFSPRVWREMVDSLHDNTTLTHLGLLACDGLNEDVFKHFMGVLQVNFTLTEVRLDGTTWETDGKKALIDEALRRNMERASYFSVFRRHELPFHPANNGRLLLFGSPFAGKTRLRHTMTRFFNGANLLGEKAAKLLRTKGVEVELLKNEQGMQLAIWDLAGQWIFRSLQDILFPRTYQASIFLFMFSPYDRKKRCIKTDLDHSLKSELEEWLRFIASNSQVTGEMLPKVIVVMSHMDKMEDHDVTWAQNILTELRDEYRDVLEICHDKFFCVNACRKKEVVPLRDFIFNMLKHLLSRTTPHAPKACSQISSILAKRTKDIKDHPVWSSQEFYSFCFDNLRRGGDINESLRPETPNGLQVFEALASYLHDIGSVVQIRSLDRIIVDPNWLTNVFLGELITIGHNFDVKSSEALQHKLHWQPISSKDGFVAPSVFQFLLTTFLKKHPKYRKLDRNLLEELLVHFDLCFKIEDGPVNSRYYIPTLVCEDVGFMGHDNVQSAGTRRIHLSWISPSEEGQEFVGFRVQCDNSRRMYLTDALFPRFQIHIRRKLLTEMDLSEDNMICSRDFMHLHHMDGHEIFVERSDKANRHIDVMVKCSKLKSREVAVKDIKKYIIDELQTFCASPKGCPGVTLVVGILQTKCVENLVPMNYRGDKQAILIQKLKETFEKYIMNRLEEINPESWSENYSSLMNYELSWPPIPECNLVGMSEPARKLLPGGETFMESVTKKVLERSEQQRQLVDQIAEEMNAEIAHDQSFLEISEVVTMSRPSEAAGDCCSSSSNTLNQSDTSQPMSRELSALGHMRREMHERFDGVELKLDENMAQIVTLHERMQSSLSNFMSKLDQMIGYAESEERSRTPKRPYLSSDDIPLSQRVIARMRLGTPVRLHLMCESMSGPHKVKDQVGILLCLEKENMEWLRCICHVSSKIVYYLGKAALHVTLGLGQALPNLDTLETTLPLSIASAALEICPTDDEMVSMEKSRTMSLNEAWIHLRSSLAPYLKDNYTELFKLFRVKYRNLKEGGYAWVCKQCMTNGIRNGSLLCL